MISRPVRRIDPRTDELGDGVEAVTGGKVVELAASAPGVFWLSRR
jgi:hypothetical protein